MPVTPLSGLVRGQGSGQRPTGLRLFRVIALNGIRTERNFALFLYKRRVALFVLTDQTVVCAAGHRAVAASGRADAAVDAVVVR